MACSPCSPRLVPFWSLRPALLSKISYILFAISKINHKPIFLLCSPSRTCLEMAVTSIQILAYNNNNKMDLLDVPQIPCLRCQTPINHLIMPEQDQGDTICERCLELESKKFIYLNLEMQIIERKLKQLRGFSDQQEGKYRESILVVEKRQEEEGGGSMDVNIISSQLDGIEAELERQRQESVRLHKELRKLESEQERKMKEYHKEVVRYDQLHRSIAQKEHLLGELSARQQQIASSSSFLQQPFKSP